MAQFRVGMTAFLSVLAASLLLITPCVGAADATSARPQFNDKGELLLPEDYRSWVYLNTALGLTYGPNRPPEGAPQVFTSVFVNPVAYAEFEKSGQWPDGTLFALEVRRAVAPASALAGAQTQGSRTALEAAVRDSSRYPDGGWAYFSFDAVAGAPEKLRASSAPFPRTASCYTCHRQHGAVQWTFTQFYADAFERAKQLGTVRKDYDPNAKIETAAH